MRIKQHKNTKTCIHNIAPKGSCAECLKLYQENYRQSITSDTYREYRLRYRFNLTADDVVDMLKEQKNRCKLCKEILVKFVIDHDHGCCPTDKGNRRSCGTCVRGLLCIPCNAMLGQISRAVRIGFKKVWSYIQ